MFFPTKSMYDSLRRKFIRMSSFGPDEDGLPANVYKVQSLENLAASCATGNTCKYCAQTLSVIFARRLSQKNIFNAEEGLSTKKYLRGNRGNLTGKSLLIIKLEVSVSRNTRRL